MLHKRQRPIIDLADWQDRAGPKSAVQWKDGRSAKEVAKLWLAASPSVPDDVLATLNAHPDFSTISDWSAEPEAKLRFDKKRGEPRNSDLLMLARDAHGPFVVAVEAKADEPFGRSIAKELVAAEKRLDANPRSGGVARIADLLASLLPESFQGAPPEDKLRYQLLTAGAGVLAYAKEHKLSRAELLIQEFVTAKTTDQRHAANAADLNRWVERISSGRFSQIRDGAMVGPITVPGAPLFPHAPALYVGKSRVHLRRSDHGESTMVAAGNA